MPLPPCSGFASSSSGDADQHGLDDLERLPLLPYRHSFRRGLAHAPASGSANCDLGVPGHPHMPR
jgi:hypothetical protein